MNYIAFYVFFAYCWLVWSAPVSFDEKWFFECVASINSGMLPYAEFYTCYQPTTMYVWSVITSLFGNSHEVIRITGMLIMGAMFWSVYYFARKLTKHAIYVVTVLLLFMTEFPTNYVSQYVIVLPIILAIVSCKDIRIIAILTALVYWFRIDTGIMVTVVCLSVYPNREVYIKSLLVGLIPLSVLALIVYSPIGIVDALSATFSVSAGRHVRVEFDTIPHIVRYFPVLAPGIMALIAGVSLYRRYDKTLSTVMVFMLMLYTQAFYFVDLSHALPANVLMIVLGFMIIEKEATG